MGSSTNGEFQNMVVLAGVVKSVKLNEGASAFMLLDVTGKDKGGNTKWVPCTIYEEPELARRIDCYREGDAIKIRGYVRAWSQKKDGEWKNAVDVRITEIKGPDPKPREKPRGREPGEDDDIASRW